MAGNHKTGDGLSKLKKNNASVPEKLGNSVGASSESISPTGKKGVHTIIHMKSLNEDEDAEDFDPVREGLIIKAVDKFLEEDADEVSDGEEGPRIFSQDYEARKKKMLQTAFDRDARESLTKPKRRFRIPAAAAAAVIFLAVAAGLGAAHADAMPEPIRVLVMQVRSLFNSASVDEEILYGENQTTDFPKEIQTVYEPSMVLDGYEVSERIEQDKRLLIYYINEKREEYSFQQMTVDFRAGYNTEGIDYKELEVNGNQGIFYIQNGQIRLQWQQDGYIFELIGFQNIEVLKELAASVKPLEDKNVIE